MATYSISGVMIPAFAYSYWVTGRPSTPLKTLWRRCRSGGPGVLPLAWPLSSGLTSRGFSHGGDVAAVELPAGFDAGQALLDVDGDGRVGVGAGGVVDGHRRLIGAGVDGDLAEGDADVGVEFAGDIDLAAARAFAGGDGCRSRASPARGRL